MPLTQGNKPRKRIAYALPTFTGVLITAADPLALLRLPGAPPLYAVVAAALRGSGG